MDDSCVAMMRVMRAMTLIRRHESRQSLRHKLVDFCGRGKDLGGPGAGEGAAAEADGGGPRPARRALLRPTNPAP